MAAVSAGTGQPNILFILSDQHAPTVAGFAGDAHVQTPHLDALARQSIRFENASCANPVCTASRMCLLTGKEAHRCAAWNNHWVIFPEHRTWPQHFAEHGYTTALVGKMHFGGRDQMQGFQYRPYGDLRHGLGHQPDPLHLFPGYAHAGSAGITEIPESLLQENVVTRESLSFLLEHQDAQPGKPWFLCASYSRPHAPFTAPGRYIRRYQGLGEALLPDTHDRPRQELDLFNQWIRNAGICREATPDVARRALEAYYACVDFLDDCIGELLQGLEKAGLLDNTIIIYSSDHGEMAGHHGVWGKSTFYEPSIGVPLMVTGPGIKKGQHHLKAPVSLIDLYPTTCTLTGLPVPEGLDGVDLTDWLAEPTKARPPRTYAPSAYYRYGIRVKGSPGAPDDVPGHAWRAVREQRWKYVVVEGDRELLFDLTNDPGETQNLVDEPVHAERRAEMRAALSKKFSWEQVHAQLAQDRQHLPQYLSGQQPTTPNQYMLADGRVFDAEASLYHARWLHIPQEATGGIIPQQFG